MSYNISKKEQHQKKLKIENTSPLSVKHSRMKDYYMTPSIEQLNLAKMGTKPTPSSLSTKSTSKQASTPSPLCSISPTHLLQTEDNALLVKSRSQEEKFTIRNKSLSFSSKPISPICTQSGCCSTRLIPKLDCSILHGMKLFSNKNMSKTETPKCGKMPSARQQEAMPKNSNNARLTGSTTPTKEKRRKTQGGILGFNQQNTGKVKLKGSKKTSNERKDKKNKKKQKITPNLKTKSEEETQKNMETVIGENQLKKEQHSDMKSEEDTQKNTHTVTGENQLKKEQDSDKTILHKDNNFGTTLVPNQLDGILKQVQKTQVKTQQKETKTNNTTEEFKETESFD